MIIRVYSRHDIESGILDVMRDQYPRQAVISITDPDTPPANIVGRQDNIAVVRSQFHDVDPDIEARSFGHYIAMVPAQAHLIVEFWQHYKDSVDLLAVHCEAGVSRSAAVAAACARMSGLPHTEFFQYPYFPNDHVYRLILKAAGIE
ncbi:MAG: hypothetical protein WC551_08625 [Patescibacteria group bacterium]